MNDFFDKITVRSSVEKILKRYFSILDSVDQENALYDKVLIEVEKALISETLKFTNNNQLKASNILGINRNTLRRKIQNLFCDNENFDA